ncbi:PEP-CTERM sorting domain-containing protein [Rivibacter subsaxonicus]|uniref:PEP-CTERM motif-containing protein n=1 Tax=Rivibacter subsaxonicus TaxID=457575 RepID=A0A4V2FSR0_9BURK|nr:PEP-CTERM sorting domain-containing protein [Rivibacter subsaxonicus]RZT95225.1 PEP-CTERM motif-containing protein [Rivibacter subsaxonicus]
MLGNRYYGWVAAGLLAVSATAHAGFDGRSFDVHYGYPDLDTVYFDASAPASFEVAAGVDTVVEVEGVTKLLVDFSDRSVTIVFNTVLEAPTWNWWVPFNGLVFDLAGGAAHGFAGASIDPTTTLAGFGADRVGLDPSRLSFNWYGLSYRDGTVLKVNFSPVPEPGTFVFALAGLALVGVCARRRRAPSAASAA